MNKSKKKNKHTNTTTSGIIYLVQPCELVGTNRYKFGCSSKPNLDRVRTGYKKGTRYLYICECINPFGLERELKKLFVDNFSLIAGNEYFQGDEYEIKKIFINEFHNYEKKYNPIANKDKEYKYPLSMEIDIITNNIKLKEFLCIYNIKEFCITNMVNYIGYIILTNNAKISFTNIYNIIKQYIFVNSEVNKYIQDKDIYELITKIINKILEYS